MEYIRTFTEEFELGDQAQLSIEIRSGALAIRGDDTRRARIEVVARLWADDDREADEQADLIRRGIRQDGSRVVIRAPTLLRPTPFLFFSRGPRIDYQVAVPKRTEAGIESRSGRVEVENVTGPLEIDARSGRVGVRQVERSVKVGSRSGSVLAEEIGGSLGVETRSGSVKVQGCRGDVGVRARSGSVQVEDVGGKLKVEAYSGAVRYEGDVADDIDISVRSGAIRLGVDPNRAFYLDAETTSGGVRSDLPMRRSGEGPAAGTGPTVRLRTRSGGIHLYPR